MPETDKNDSNKTAIARPMPRPTAQVAPYVDILGADLAVRFLMTYGGAELYLADDPKGRASHEVLLGHDKAKALAAHPCIGPRHRVPRATACPSPNAGLPPCCTGKATPPP